MSTASRWLNCTPDQQKIISDSPEMEPTKPSKMNFVGFEGSVSEESKIIRGLDPPTGPAGKGYPAARCYAYHGSDFCLSVHGSWVCETCRPPGSEALVVEPYALPSEARRHDGADKPGAASPGKGCPYPLPEGIIRLVLYVHKKPSVAVTVCSVVTDVDKFIRHPLGELDARLHNPVQINAGDSASELLSKLGDCGLELRLESPPEGQIMGESREGEPTKPTKVAVPEINAHGGDLTDEDIPY